MSYLNELQTLFFEVTSDKADILIPDDLPVDQALFELHNKSSTQNRPRSRIHSIIHGP